MLETIKTWAAYVSSILVGAVGFIEKCSELANFAFVLLGCVGLVLSIKLSLKKLRKFDEEKKK